MVILFFVVYVAPPSVVSSISSTAYRFRDEAIAPTHRDEAPPRRHHLGHRVEVAQVYICKLRRLEACVCAFVGTR